MHKRRAGYRKGLYAEWLAMLFLMCKGYRLLRWRARTPLGEVDLVMAGHGQLVFVEVKARATARDAMEAVNMKNQQRVAHAAQYLLASMPAYATRPCRFDVVAIPWYLWPTHIVHAFS